MTKAEMKKEILKHMSADKFEERYLQLIDWNTQNDTLQIMLNEINTKADIINSMHNIYYGIG